MTIPQQHNDWLKEIQTALMSAILQAKRESSDLEHLFELAPDYVAKNRGITNTQTIAKMRSATVKTVLRDWIRDENSRNHYRFHFVISYIDSHVTAELIDEMPADRVMEYVNDSMNLFEH